MSGVHKYSKTSTVTGSKIRNELFSGTTVTGSKIRNELVSGTILESIKEPTESGASGLKIDNTMVISYNISKSQTESKVLTSEKNQNHKILRVLCSNGH